MDWRREKKSWFIRSFARCFAGHLEEGELAQVPPGVLGGRALHPGVGGPGVDPGHQAGDVERGREAVAVAGAAAVSGDAPDRWDESWPEIYLSFSTLFLNFPC